MENVEGLTWDQLFDLMRRKPRRELINDACEQCQKAMDYLTTVFTYQKSKNFLFHTMVAFAVCNDGVLQNQEYQFISDIWKSYFNEVVSYDVFKQSAEFSQQKYLSEGILAAGEGHFKRSTEYTVAICMLGIIIYASDGYFYEKEKNLIYWINSMHFN